MAGKRIYIDLTGNGDVDGREDISPRERDNEQTIQAFLDEFGGVSHKASLYKLREGTARWDWLAHYLPDAVSPETVRQEWGAGTYAVNLLDERGHYITRRIFDIGGAPEDWERGRVTSGRAAAARDGSAEDSKSQDRFLELMRQQHETMLALLTNKGGDTGLKEAVELAKLLTPQQGKPTDQLAFVAEVIKLGRELGGGSDNSIAGLIKEVAPAVMGPLLAARTNGNGTTPGASSTAKPAPQLPAPRDVKPPEPAAPERAPNVPAEAPAEVERLLYAQFQFWKGKARRPDSDPGFWVDYVFENDDEPTIQAVLWAVRHYGFDQLVQFDPELGTDAGLREWFQQLYEGIQDGLREHDTAVARGAGNTADAGGDARPDPAGGAHPAGERNGDRAAAEPIAPTPA